MDRRGSSLLKEGRSLRRDSPSHEASHRWILMFHLRPTLVLNM
jgi:hypothetical protein